MSSIIYFVFKPLLPEFIEVHNVQNYVVFGKQLARLSFGETHEQRFYILFDYTLLEQLGKDICCLC